MAHILATLGWFYVDKNTVNKGVTTPCDLRLNTLILWNTNNPHLNPRGLWASLVPPPGAPCVQTGASVGTRESLNCTECKRTEYSPHILLLGSWIITMIKKFVTLNYIDIIFKFSSWYCAWNYWKLYAVLHLQYSTYIFRFIDDRLHIAY
jgi:hypothetical protein